MRLNPRRVVAMFAAVASAMIVSLPAQAPAAVPDGGDSGYQVLSNDQKSALDLQILENFVPYAETFWRPSDIAEPDTGMFVASGAGVSESRGTGNVDFVLATLLTALPGQEVIGGVDRATLLDQLIKSIRYNGFTNVFSGAGYNQWGAANDFEFSLETYLWADAAYLIWNQLDADTQALVRQVVTAEADMEITTPAVDAAPGNTGGETDAWDAPTPALAAVMFPSDPNRAAWEQTAIRFALNASSIPGDKTSSQVVDGKPLREWITTTNLNSDLTLENHGFFNMTYEMVTHLLINDAAIFYAQAGMPEPQAFSFRTNQIWQQVIEPLTADDGDLISPAGQDWASKDYQWLDYYGTMATRFGSPVASVLESRGVQLVGRRQAGTGNGSITGMAQLGYESHLAKRIASDWWSHKLFPPSPTPSQADFDAAYRASAGVHIFPDVDVIEGRLGAAAATMSWDPDSPMGTWTPRSFDDMTDPVFTNTAAGSLFATARGTPVGPHTCACATDEFATAATVGSKNLAMAAFPDGTTLLLDQGTGATFTYSIDQIPGMTGDRPVYSAGGSGLGTLSGNWVDVAGRMAMIVAGGSGINAQTLAPGSNFGSNDTVLQLTGSTGTGSGNRGAELAAGTTPPAAAELAAHIAQPAAPVGWGALQAQAPDGTDRLVIARWSGPDQATFALTDDRGAPVPAETATVTGSTASFAIAPDPTTPSAPAAVQETVHYFVRSDAPIQVRQTADGSASLSNPSVNPVSVTLTYVPGTGPAQTVQRTLAGGETAIGRVVGGSLVAAGPEYEHILAADAGAARLADLVAQWKQAGRISTSDAAALTGATNQISDNLGPAATIAVQQSPDTAQEAARTVNATSALARIVPAPDMSATVAQAVQAVHDSEADELARAAAALRVTLLVEPDGKLQPGQQITFTVYALNRSQAAATSGQLSLGLSGSASGRPVSAFSALEPGATTARRVDTSVPAGATLWSDITATAALSYTTQGGSTEQVTGTGDFTVTPLFSVSATEPDLPLAAGGWNQETYTISSLADQPLTITLAGKAPEGVTSTLSAPAVTVPANGSAQVSATLTNAGVSTGSGALTLTATADGVTVTASSLLHFSTDLALNPYGTDWPHPFASSNQTAFPPTLAVDGDPGTFWVSGGPATAGSGPTPQHPEALGVDFGSPVTVASVTMTPRPNRFGPTDYSIQTSPDGRTWTTIGTVTAADAVASTTTAVSPATTRWLRLLITGSHDATDRNVQVAELSATGP